MPRTFAESHHADRVSEAQIEDLARTLRSYGVLTRNGLRELCHGDHWGLGGFELALSTAVRRGVIAHLGADLEQRRRSVREPGQEEQRDLTLLLRQRLHLRRRS